MQRRRNLGHEEEVVSSVVIEGPHDHLLLQQHMEYAEAPSK
jgi:hypothetical protein